MLATNFSKTMAAGILGRPDPEGVWHSIVSYIPDEVLAKPNVKILNVACGHRTETKILIKRMRALGKTAEEIKDSIYLNDKYEQFCNRARREGFRHIIHADFLKHKFNMKFDIIISNPPYQKDTVSDGKKQGGLWWEIITKTLSMLNDDGLLVMVTPSSMFSAGGFGGKKHKVSALKKAGFSLTHIWASLTEQFSVGISISGFIARKGDYNKVEIVDHGTTVELDYKTPIPFMVNKHAISVINKAYNLSNPWAFTENDKSVDSDKIVQINAGRFKSYKKLFIGYKVDSPNKAMSCILDPATDIDNVKSAFNSKLYTFLFKSLGGESGQSCTGILQRLPHLSLDRKWTDEEIYKHFDLTQDEINYIEENV